MKVLMYIRNVDQNVYLYKKNKENGRRYLAFIQFS